MQGRPTRRDMLLGTGAAMAGGLAGCLGGDGDDGGDGGDDGGTDGGTDGDGGDGDGGDGDGGDGGDGNGGDYPWMPEDDILVTIPFGQGGGTDTYARQLWPVIGEYLETNVRIENMTAAGGMEAVGRAMRADPDGHTMTAFNPPSTPLTYFILDPPFNMEELTPVAIYAKNTPVYLMWGRVEHEFQGVQDVIDRYNDGEFEAWGVQDVGGPTSVASIIMRDNPDIDHGFASMVNFTGTGPFMQALVGGDVPAGLGSSSGGGPVYEDSPDVIEPIAYMHSSGSQIVPDLDIDYFHEEMGVNLDYLTGLNRLYLGPPELPDDIADTYEQVIEEVLQDDQIVEWSEENGFPIGFGSRQEAQDLHEETMTQIPEQVDLEELRQEFG